MAAVRNVPVTAVSSVVSFNTRLPGVLAVAGAPPSLPSVKELVPVIVVKAPELPEIGVLVMPPADKLFVTSAEFSVACMLLLSVVNEPELPEIGLLLIVTPLIVPPVKAIPLPSTVFVPKCVVPLIVFVLPDPVEPIVLITLAAFAPVPNEFAKAVLLVPSVELPLDVSVVNVPLPPVFMSVVH